MRELKFDLIIFTLLLFVGCSTNEKNFYVVPEVISNENTDDKSIQVENFLDIPKFANGSSAEIDKAIGNLTKTRFEKLMSLRRGEIRTYRLENLECGIGFYQNKAVEFVCNLDENNEFENPKQLARSFGFEISDDSNHLVSTNQTHYWKGTFGRTDFYSIVVSKGASDKFSKILAVVKY